MNQTFTLSNNPPPTKPHRFESCDRTRQKLLFSGLNCLPGQMDLFDTDGPPAGEEQAADRRPDRSPDESAS